MYRSVERTKHSIEFSHLLTVHKDDVIPRYFDDVVLGFELNPPRITLVSHQLLYRLCRDVVVKGYLEAGGVCLLNISESCDELFDDALLGGVTHYPRLRQLLRRISGLPVQRDHLYPM